MYGKEKEFNENVLIGQSILLAAGCIVSPERSLIFEKKVNELDCDCD